MSDYPVLLAPADKICLTTFGEEGVGNAISSVVSATSGAWPTADKAIFVPIKVRSLFTAMKMSICNGAAVSNNVDTGFYDIDGNRLASKGSTAQSGTAAAQTFDITDTTTGMQVIYAALALDNTTGAVLRSNASVQICSAAGVLCATSAFPLPPTVTFAPAADAFIPWIQIAGRTLF